MKEFDKNKNSSKISRSPITFTIPSGIINDTILLSPQEIFQKAYDFHVNGKLKEAENYYQFLVNSGFCDPSLFTNFSLICKANNNLNYAIYLCKRSIKLFPDHAESYCNLGGIYRDLNRLEEAKILLIRAIEISPDLAESYYNLSNVYYQQGSLDKAEISARKAIALKPNYAEAYSNLGLILFDLDKLNEAEILLRRSIQIKPNFFQSYSNLGNVLRSLGKLKEAESAYLKAIKIEPNCSNVYYNLGSILKDLGRLEEAKNYYIKSIKIDKNLIKSYYAMSTLSIEPVCNKLFDYIFSKKILLEVNTSQKIDIYFARANIFHKKKNYEDSSICLEKANKLKLDLNKSNLNQLIKKSKQCLLISETMNDVNREDLTSPLQIFIVGMPRCGSTLVESIISMNSNIIDLGELNIFEKIYLEWTKHPKDAPGINLSDLYYKKIVDLIGISSITTNKWLFNYQYAGIIASQISNAKIIHCFRNPLDNILSIYRAHFAHNNYYSSCLSDCAELYLDHENIMSEYKNKYRSNIYDLNYDLLVSKPDLEIPKLIHWLGLDWDDIYLSPHLNSRNVSTASNVQVRFPITSSSLGGWKNYRKMLTPAINILMTNKTIKDLIR
tara:strand:- start:3998 stop:5833 length:1836 start_codon:yes stop_codon:yes gene_type:complete